MTFGTRSYAWLFCYRDLYIGGDLVFEKKYRYYLVQFDNGRTAWYRSDEGGYKAGMKVIVPITDNGMWDIALIAEAKRFAQKQLPCPLTQTAGIVCKAGITAKHKVKAHNDRLAKCKQKTIDISTMSVRTRKGTVSYVTCKEERELFRRKLGRKVRLIESCPPVKFSQIPKQAQKAYKNEKFEELNSFMELMEDTDQFN